MKKIKFKFLALFILLFVAAVTPSCEAFLQALEESSQVDNDSNNNNNNQQTDPDSDGTTSLGKK